MVRMIPDEVLEELFQAEDLARQDYLQEAKQHLRNFLFDAECYSLLEVLGL